jgi:hypothetical protein
VGHRFLHLDLEERFRNRIHLVELRIWRVHVSTMRVVTHAQGKGRTVCARVPGFPKSLKVLANGEWVTWTVSRR